MNANILIVPLALSLLFLPTAAAEPGDIEVHVTEGPYNEPCTGMYNGGHIVFVVCAGKGLFGGGALDCVVYVHIRTTGQCL